MTLLRDQYGQSLFFDSEGHPQRKLDAGTYFVELRGSNGDYSLGVPGLSHQDAAREVRRVRGQRTPAHPSGSRPHHPLAGKRTNGAGQPPCPVHSMSPGEGHPVPGRVMAVDDRPRWDVGRGSRPVPHHAAVNLKP